MIVRPISQPKPVFAQEEKALIRRLNTPDKVQEFLIAEIEYDNQDEIEEEKETWRSLRRVIRDRKAHCFEGALAAAAILMQHNYPPLILCMEARDIDHIVFAYKRKGKWGCVAKSRDENLLNRAPHYRGLRDLVMSVLSVLLQSGDKRFDGPHDKGLCKGRSQNLRQRLDHDGRRRDVHRGSSLPHPVQKTVSEKPGRQILFQSGCRRKCLRSVAETRSRDAVRRTRFKNHEGAIMNSKPVDRRDFIKTLLGSLSVVALDWSSFPTGKGIWSDEDKYDAVIIGSGLGGLSCAAAFARQGFKALVLEKHDRPGGYATTFSRPGGFVFDASLHSTSVGERNGLHNLIYGFPEIADVEFVPHRNLYRVIYPDYDIRVPQKDVAGYVKLLSDLFPDEGQGIQGLVDDMKGLAGDINRLTNARGKIDMSRFPQDFPYLFGCYNKTWGQMVDARIKNPKLRSIVSTLWGYYGLPPSKLSAVYYALPTYGYLQQGGYYPIRRSQGISNAFVKFIEDRGGKVVLNARVTDILTKDHAAYGVKTADGREFTGKVVISNANAYDTFHSMVKEGDFLKEVRGENGPIQCESVELPGVSWIERRSGAESRN